MRADPGRLEGLIASVADGWPQDWDAIRALSPDESTRRALSSLRTVAAIADFHRGVTPLLREAGTRHRRTKGSLAGSPREDRSVSEVPGPAPARWGRFVILKKLGEGGFGEVYQAHDTQLARDVALKLLRRRSSADPGERLLREARMLARVRHPNVASVYGAGVHEGRAGLWMELVRGANLEEFLRMRGPMSACEAALVGIDVCRALAAVHAAGLVHRDVKASNVLREVGGRIVLTDFGAGSDPGLRPRRRLAGTPLYLAPEVLAGSEATVRSDLYSLGVILFRLVTDSYPRRVLSMETPFGPGHADVPTSLRDLRPDLPDAFVAAVELVLAADPDNRPSSAGALRAMLGLVLGVPTSWRRACHGPRPALPPDPTVALDPAKSQPGAATADPSRPRGRPSCRSRARATALRA